jgi:hypothetical protein
MPYFSLLKNIPGIFTQPTGIAAIASVGIHGAIAMIVPLVPVDSSASQETEAPRTVGLVTINPSDLNQQQPNPDPSQQAALQQSQIALQEPELPLKQQIPPSNSSDTSVTLPPLQTPPPVQQPPSPSVSQSSSGFAISSLPRSQALPRFNRNNFRADRFSPAIPPRFTAQADGIAETPPININKINRESQKNPDLDPTPIKQPSSGLFDPETTQPVAASLGNSQQTSPLSNNNLTANSLPLSSTTGANVEHKSLLASAGSLSAENLGKQTEPLSDVTKKTETQSQITKQPLVALNLYKTHREKIQKEYPNIQEKAPIRETIPTDNLVKEASVSGDLIVNPDGKVVDIKFEDELVSSELQSKVREFFNAKLKDVKKLSWYPFELRFRNNPAGVATEGSSSTTSSSDQVTPQSPQTPKSKGPNTPLSFNNSKSSLVSTETAQKLIKQLQQII